MPKNSSALRARRGMLRDHPDALLKIASSPVQLFWMEGRPTPLDGYGPTDVPYDSERAADFERIGGFEVIAQTARENPDKVAVDDGQDRLTYSQFVDRVYGLAEHLNSIGENSSIVASVIPNSVTAPIAIMACALTGRILVPSDAVHPLERQRAIFMESGAHVVLLAKNKNNDLSFVSPTIPRLVVDPLLTTTAKQTAYPYNRNSPLFVTFTSGSTGRPKGVVSGGRYGGMALRQFVDMFHLNSSDVVLGLASLSTGGARDAFAALGVGATIRLLELRAGGIGEMLQVMRANEVTVLSFVPSAFRVMLAIVGAEEAFISLRVLIHGEQIFPSDIQAIPQQIAARLSHQRDDGLN